MIGVIADDLTGAAEIGGVGLRHGLKSEVILRGKCYAGADLICLDTHSRSCSAMEAERRAADAARKLRKAGAAWIYKKVDSVLRGNVVAEIQAIRQALDLTSALLVPANPCFGRTIHDGRYFVHGKPIDQTDFARDPEYPRSTSNVLELLGAAKSNPVTICRLSAPLPASGIILGEVSSSENVHRWAVKHEKNMLAAGGAEFFEALLAAVRPLPKTSAFSSFAAGRHSEPIRELFICGSSSDFTQQFADTARANRNPVFSLLDLAGKDWSIKQTLLKVLAEKATLAFRSHPRVILTIGRPIITQRSVAQRLTGQLVTLAMSVMAKSKPGHVYAEGGATAAELVRRLHWNRMSILAELAPGVITLSQWRQSTPLLTIKPGSYSGWPTNDR